MVNSWTEATDRTGSTVRVASFDYYKAFNLMKHHIPAKKVSLLSMPLFIKRWVINFLIRRQVKLADILSGVPQGTKLRPWLFLLMINDLWSPQVQTWKYIDDTTISEVMPECSTTNIHDAVDNIQTWSTTDRLQLNVAKYKELVISFSKPVNNFPSLNIDSVQLKVVMNARVLGLTISNNLKWNDHMANIIKKANKPLYFIVKMHQSP